MRSPQATESFSATLGHIRLAHTSCQSTDVFLQRVVIPLQFLVPILHRLDLLYECRERRLVFYRRAGKDIVSVMFTSS